MSEQVDCMPKGLLVESSSGTCPSSDHLLISLAAFNIWSALLTLIFGKLSAVWSTSYTERLT